MANLKSNLGSKMTNLANNMARANYRATTALPSLGDGNIFNAWYNMDRAMRERYEAQEAIKKLNAWDEMMARSPYGNKQLTMPQFDIGEGVVADRNGWRGTPQQQTTNPFGIDTSGWGNPSGNSINVGSFDTPKQNAWTTAFGGVKSFNQPPTDNPLAQAVEGQLISPNYMSLMSNGLMTPQQQLEFNDKMNLRLWIEWDAKMNGVTNPLVSAQRYLIFVEPLKKQAEVLDLRNAYLTLQNPKSTDEEKMNAIALIEYDRKNPYMNEDHDMNVERFNWAKQNFENAQKMFPLQLEKAQLGTLLQRQQLDANELANTGEYAGVNLEGDSWYRKNDGVDLSNLQSRALAGLNHASVIFKSMFGEPLMVTSGRDSDAHMGGQYSHYTGWKVDVSSGMDSKRLEDPQERAKFIQALGSVGIIVNDEWAKDKHLDLNFQNYHGNYTRNRNRNLNKNGLPNNMNINKMSYGADVLQGIETSIADLKSSSSDENNPSGILSSAARDKVVGAYYPIYIDLVGKIGTSSAKQKIKAMIDDELGKDGKKAIDDNHIWDIVNRIENKAYQLSPYNISSQFSNRKYSLEHKTYGGVIPPEKQGGFKEFSDNRIKLREDLLKRLLKRK